MPNPSPYNPLLNLVTDCLHQLDYKSIHHARLSVFNGIYGRLHEASYQGLSRAKTRVGGDVFVKWQLDSFNNGQTVDDDFKHDLQREIAVYKSLSPLSNANPSPILSPIATHHQQTASGQKFIALVLLYCPAGSVKQWLASHQLSHDAKTTLIKAMAISLYQLHELGWVHGDIKPSNFLRVEQNGQVSVKLIDLSHAMLCDNSTANQTYHSNPTGTPAYLAPELWQGHSISHASDVYAFGVTVFEILGSKLPFTLMNEDSMNEVEKSQMWQSSHGKEPIPALPKAWQHWQTLLESMLAKQPNNRPNMRQVMQHIGKFGADFSANS